MKTPSSFVAVLAGAWIVCFAVGLSAAVSIPADSAWVFPAADGRLLYLRDALGNRIPDFSGVGYRGGTVPVPDVPARVVLDPGSGDDGAAIQSALDQVAALPLDARGFRGAVLLRAGEYQIAGQLEIRASGVVLRGAGASGTGTVLRATGTGQRTLISVLGSGSHATVSGSTRNIVDPYVPVGAVSFTVDNTNGLAPGVRVVVRRPSPSNWIQDLGMDQLASPWTAGSRDQRFDRVITRLEGNRVFLDAPITTALEQRYGGGTIYRYTWSGRLQNVGIEDLAGLSDFAGATDEDHAWTFISLAAIEHGWVRRVTARHFGFNCVALLSGAQWITVADCQSLDPISQIVGSRRYAFYIDDAQHCLFRNCYTREDRHQFITGSSFPGPVVFVDGRSENAYNDAGPHHRWFNGGLWDRLELSRGTAVPTPTQVSAPASLNLQNRGNLGSGHGWTGANSVAWNCRADGGFIVQNPPTARNWLIGAVGTITNGTNWVGFHDPGTYDSPSTNVFPHSLYWGQVQDRLRAPGLQLREYVTGDFDNFTGAGAAGDVVPVDAAWLGVIRGAGHATTNFDVGASNRWVPFTFNFAVAPTDRVVSATLTLSLRASGGTAGGSALYVGSLTNVIPFAVPGGSIGPTSTVKVCDLGDQLALLQGGRLNAAVGGGASVDWAVLELGVAPALQALALQLAPEADAFVRGGGFTNNNFGTLPTLAVQESDDDNDRRRAFLRWDLSRLPRDIAQATVRLMAVHAGLGGIENAAVVVPDSGWDESGLRWTDAPGVGHRFVSWRVKTNQPVAFVVTPQVQEVRSGDGRFSLGIVSIHDHGAGGGVDYASREHADAASRPQLVLVLPNAGPVQPVSMVSTNLVGIHSVNLAWDVEPGKTYYVLYKDRLDDAGWKVPAGVILTNNARARLEDAVTNRPQRFYQVIQQ